MGARPPIDDYSYWLLEIERKIKEVNKLLLDNNPQGVITLLQSITHDIGHLASWVGRKM